MYIQWKASNMTSRPDNFLRVNGVGSNYGSPPKKKKKKTGAENEDQRVIGR